MWPGPQASEIGELEAWTRLTTVRRLCGQVPMGPSGVPDQSLALISLAISPPPINQPSSADNLVSVVTRAIRPFVGRKGSGILRGGQSATGTVHDEAVRGRHLQPAAALARHRVPPPQIPAAGSFAGSRGYPVHALSAPSVDRTPRLGAPPRA